MEEAQMVEDKELVTKAIDGDNHAFDELVLRYQPKVARLMSRYAYEPSEIKDLTQDVFMKVYTALESFRGDSAFYTWLYRVAINTAKNHVILKGRRPPATDIDVVLSEQVLGKALLKDLDDPEDCMLRDEIEEKVFDALDKLPEELAICFVLRELEEFSYDDIADVLDCPVGTVRSRIFRAREAIEKEITDLLRTQ